jgi:pyrroloquinoline-quinone synthase
MPGFILLLRTTEEQMERLRLAEELQRRIAKYDLLCHPFYQAWSAGELTREDLREYAGDYYHHVAAFPNYLAEFFARTANPELRRAVLSNLNDEEGCVDGGPGRSHAEMWLDFADGLGADREQVRREAAPAYMNELTAFFHHVAKDGAPEAALASFYAYESQVPRVAEAKARGLKEWYGADDDACAYFTLHQTADVAHSQIWLQQLHKRVDGNPAETTTALDTAELAARKLWEALDGVESRRQQRQQAKAVPA